MSGGALCMLQIEVDAHHRGGRPHQPWVARIDGIDPVYGLARTFVQRLNDHAGASRAWSGNLYGIVAGFPLREGNLYEVSRTRGKSSKRYVTREFVEVVGGEVSEVDPHQALARAARHPRDGTRILKVRDDLEVAVRHVNRLMVDEEGTSHPVPGPVCGWIVVGFDRHYLLEPGKLYEVREGSERRLVLGDHPGRVTRKEAAAWLAAHV